VIEHFWSVVAPSWATGAGTVGLAALAFVDIRRSQREAKEARTRADTLEASAELERVQARERAQAEQVVAWIGSAAETPWSNQSVIVSNASPFPIFEVVLEVRKASEVVPPPVQLPIVAPQRQAVQGLSATSNDSPYDPRVEFTFTDAQGVRWKRTCTGLLHMLPPVESE
jgi:hypothetical protein